VRIAIALTILTMTVASTADVFRHVDERGGVRYSDKPGEGDEAKCYSEGRERARQRAAKNIAPRRVNSEQRARIKEDFAHAERALLRVEKQQFATCGEQPRGGFIGGGPKRERHIAYDDCVREFRPLLERARTQYNAAQRVYLSME
jgi:hypothetical protein